MWKTLHLSDRLALQTIANSNGERDAEFAIYFTHTQIGDSELGVTQFSLILITVDSWQICVIADQELDRSEIRSMAREAAEVYQDDQKKHAAVSVQAPNCVAWMFENEELVYSDVAESYQSQMIQAASNLQKSSFMCFEKRVLTKMEGLTCLFEFDQADQILVQECWLQTKRLLDSL